MSLQIARIYYKLFERLKAENILIAGERTFGVAKSADDVAELSPHTGNLHEIEALDDETAFFDVSESNFSD